MPPLSATTVPLSASACPLPRRTLRVISQRWAEWEPFVRLWAQHYDDPPARTELLRREHAKELANLILIHRIEMRCVRRLALDDPRPPSWSRRLDELRRYLERRSRAKQRPSQRRLDTNADD